MKRVYIGVYGVGLGHASRMVYIANKLKHDKILKFSSFGDAVNYIRAEGYSCIDVPPVEVNWDPLNGFSVTESIMKIPINFMNFVRQCGKEASHIGKFKPNLIISDTRLSSLLIAKLYNMPTITILNQIKLLLSNRLRELTVTRAFEDILGEIFGLLWGLSNEIFIPDLPYPYTISEDNLWNVNSIDGKLKYIGFLTPKPIINEENVKRVYDMLNIDNKPIVFAHISGPSVTKLLLIKDIINTLKDKNDITLIVSEGRPNGDIAPKRIKNGWYFEWCPYRDEIFALSELLIVRGGHSTITQCIQYGKPIISIPIENHGEQLGNSKKIDKLKIGIMLKQKEVNKLSYYIDLLLNDDIYKNNMQRVMEIANKLNGVETIVNKIEEY